MQPPPQKPAYVVTIPKFAPVEQDAETSSGESSDNSFPKEYFRERGAYFRLAAREPKNKKQDWRTKIRGTLADDNVYVPNEIDTNHFCGDLVHKFETEAFATVPEKSLPEAKQRLALSVCLNRMRSLSATMNRQFEVIARKKPPTEIAYRQVGIFWDGQWEERKRGRWVSVKYTRVRKFYRQFKKKDMQSAREFRATIESRKMTHLQIPYRELRDFVKKQENTKELVKMLRQKNPKQEIYLGIADDDVVSLRSKELGAYSHYDAMVTEHLAQHGTPLEIASVGYRIEDGNNPLLAVGVELDLSARNMTARSFKDGVYYPEPSSIVRILPNTSTVDEIFSKPGDTTYTSPMEMPILIRNIIAARQFDPQKSMMFAAEGAITTGTFTEQKFIAHIGRSKMIVRWTEGQLQKLRNIRQSHFKIKQWADNLLPALKIPEVVNFDGELITRAALKFMIISILCRIYKHYDAISIAQVLTVSANDNGLFPARLIQVLDEYDSLIAQKNRVLQPPVKKGNRSDKYRKIWEKLDNISNVDVLVRYLAVLLGGDEQQAKRVQNAAIACGKQAVHIFNQRLSKNFPELCFALMCDYFNELREYNNEEKIAEENIVLGSEVNLRILHNQDILESENKLALKKEFQKLARVSMHSAGTFQTHPLHWAAITGNLALIECFEKQSDELAWRKDVNNAVAACGVTPLHCAIKFCADNGYDERVILPLVTPENVLAKTSNGETPLLLAIRELADPLPCVKLLSEHGAKLRGVVDRDGFPPIMAAIKYVENPLELIKLLIRYGADVNEPGGFEDEEETTAIHEAMAPLSGGSAAPGVFDYLMSLPNIDLSVEDGGGNSLLDEAFDCLKGDDFIIELCEELLRRGCEEVLYGVSNVDEHELCKILQQADENKFPSVAEFVENNYSASESDACEEDSEAEDDSDIIDHDTTSESSSESDESEPDVLASEDAEKAGTEDMEDDDSVSSADNSADAAYEADDESDDDKDKPTLQNNKRPHSEDSSTDKHASPPKRARTEELVTNSAQNLTYNPISPTYSPATYSGSFGIFGASNSARFVYKPTTPSYSPASPAYTPNTPRRSKQ